MATKILNTCLAPYGVAVFQNPKQIVSIAVTCLQVLSTDCDMDSFMAKVSASNPNTKNPGLLCLMLGLFRVVNKRVCLHSIKVTVHDVVMAYKYAIIYCALTFGIFLDPIGIMKLTGLKGNKTYEMNETLMLIAGYLGVSAEAVKRTWGFWPSFPYPFQHSIMTNREKRLTLQRKLFSLLERRTSFGAVADAIVEWVIMEEYPDVINSAYDIFTNVHALLQRVHRPHWSLQHCYSTFLDAVVVKIPRLARELLRLYEHLSLITMTEDNIVECKVHPRLETCEQFELAAERGILVLMNDTGLDITNPWLQGVTLDPALVKAHTAGAEPVDPNPPLARSVSGNTSP